jgi:multimeric flavodoxin WrbA
MRALCLNCTLKLSPEPSNTADLAGHVLADLRERGFETDIVRVTDHRIDPGVVSEAVTDGDEWPALRERIVAADVLIIATPIWIGQPSSVSKRVLERMDAFLSETQDDGRTPIAYGKVAGVITTGNEDGAHHVIGEINAALNDLGYTLPAQNWTYWNKGPGPGSEEWDSTDEKEWTLSTGRAMASNLAAVATALRAHPIPAPPGS